MIMLFIVILILKINDFQSSPDQRNFWQKSIWRVEDHRVETAGECQSYQEAKEGGGEVDTNRNQYLQETADQEGFLPPQPLRNHSCRHQTNIREIWLRLTWWNIRRYHRLSNNPLRWIKPGCPKRILVFRAYFEVVKWPQIRYFQV